MKMNNSYLLFCSSHKVAALGMALVVTYMMLLVGCATKMKDIPGTDMSQQVASNASVPSTTMTSGGGEEPTPTVDAEDVLPLIKPVTPPTWEEIRDKIAQKDPGWVNYLESLKGMYVEGWTGSILQIYYHRDNKGVQTITLDMDGPNDSAGHYHDAHVVLMFIDTTDIRPWEVGQQVTIEGKILDVSREGMIFIADPKLTLIPTISDGQ